MFSYRSKKNNFLDTLVVSHVIWNGKSPDSELHKYIFPLRCLLSDFLSGSVCVSLPVYLVPVCLLTYLKNKCRSQWPIFHSLVILLYILKSISYINIIFNDYESILPKGATQIPTEFLFHFIGKGRFRRAILSMVALVLFLHQNIWWEYSLEHI